MEPAGTTDTYELYRIPILLNDERYTLTVSFADGVYDIIGARKAIDQQLGLVDKNLRKLVPGDIVKPVYLKADGSGEIAINQIIITDATSFAEKPLPSGTWQAAFVMIDFTNSAHPSQPVVFSR
jgi:hypothetical protein